MPSIRIFTDSTADLSPELLARHQIGVVPLLVQFDHEEYQDGVEIDTERLFELVEAKGRLPKTASPSPAAFQAAFAEAVAEGSQVLYIGLSSQLSATVQNAQIAAQSFPEGMVTVVDSANLSTGVGLQVLYAADLVAEGRGVAEITAALAQARPGVRTAFLIDTLEYLHKGGRCSGMAALVGSLLRMRPVIAVEEGQMTVASKVRGARQKGLDWMLASFEQDVLAGRVRPERVFVSHTGGHDEAAYMRAEVKRLLPGVAEVLETRAGSVIGSHCGPGTISLVYMTK